MWHRLQRLSADINKANECLRHWGAGEGDALQVRFVRVLAGGLNFLHITTVCTIGYSHRLVNFIRPLRHRPLAVCLARADYPGAYEEGPVTRGEFR